MKVEGGWKVKGWGSGGDRGLESSQDNAVSRGHVLPHGSYPMRASTLRPRAPCPHHQVWHWSL